VGFTLFWAIFHVRDHGMFWKGEPSWEQGWPTTARVERLVDALGFVGAPHFGDPGNIVEWRPLELFINSTAAGLILPSVIFACERWRRRGILPWQFNIGFVLATITVVAVLWWMHGHVDELMHRWTSHTGLLSFLPEYDDYDWLETFPVFATIPLVFGECCLVY